jgi:hypothetical protein
VSHRAPTIHLEAEVSRESLLKAIEQLSPTELDQFVSEVLDLHARRGTKRPTATESGLLTRNNEGLQGLTADAPVSIDRGGVNTLDSSADSAQSTTGTLPSGIVS